MRLVGDDLVATLKANEGEIAFPLPVMRFRCGVGIKNPSTIDEHPKMQNTTRVQNPVIPAAHKKNSFVAEI
jgi:hypothetical protein